MFYDPHHSLTACHSLLDLFPDYTSNHQGLPPELQIRKPQQSTL